MLKSHASFINPMLLLPAAELPEGDKWLIELKLDGFRAIAFKTGGKVQLRSRNDKDFNSRYPAIIRALDGLPDETVIEGEVVALDHDGRPSFNALQNLGSVGAALVYYVFDLMVLRGRDVMAEPLDARRALLEAQVLPTLKEPVRYSPELRARMADLVQSVKAQRLEGLIAKRRDSLYEPGERSGAWLKMRVNRGQEFVIGGYTVGGATFDALIFGYYDGCDLIYAARTRNGFKPQLRAELMKKLHPLETQNCPFLNLPEKTRRPLGRRSDGSKNGGMPLAEAPARRAIRVRRMDTRQSPAALTFHRAARGSQRRGRSPRELSGLSDPHFLPLRATDRLGAAEGGSQLLQNRRCLD